MELNKFWQLVPGREALDVLTLPQAESLFRLLILASFADNTVSDEERMTLAVAVTRLPFFRPEEWHVFEHGSGLQILGDLYDRYRREPLTVLEEICDPLDTDAVQLVALRIVARFMQGDGYRSDEHAFCLMIGQAFGFDAPRINLVLEEAVAWADGP